MPVWPAGPWGCGQTPGPGAWGVGPGVWGSPLPLGGRDREQLCALDSFRKPPKKLLLSGSAERSGIFLRCGPRGSYQAAHLHRPGGGVGGAGALRPGQPGRALGSRSEAAPWEKARAAAGSEGTRTLFLLLRPHFPGAPAGWPSAGLEPSCGGCSCLKTMHWDRRPVLAPGTSLQGPAGKGGLRRACVQGRPR